MSKKKKHTPRGVQRRERMPSLEEKESFIKETIIRDLKNKQVVGQIFEDYFIEKKKNEDFEKRFQHLSIMNDVLKEKNNDLMKTNKMLNESHMKRMELMEKELVLFREEDKKKTEEICFLRSEISRLIDKVKKKDKEIESLKVVVKSLGDDLEKTKEKVDVFEKQIADLWEAIKK